MMRCTKQIQHQTGCEKSKTDDHHIKLMIGRIAGDIKYTAEQTARSHESGPCVPGQRREHTWPRKRPDHEAQLCGDHLQCEGPGKQKSHKGRVHAM